MLILSTVTLVLVVAVVSDESDDITILVGTRHVFISTIILKLYTGTLLLQLLLLLLPLPVMKAMQHNTRRHVNIQTRRADPVLRNTNKGLT